MGSRIMHYCISLLINRTLRLKEEEQFVLGGLAPDVHKYMNEPKTRSHFIDTDADGNVYMDYGAFFNKYLVNRKTAFHLGYYCHLISDDIWLKEIYIKKIKWLPLEAKKEAQQKSYRDFRRLNGKLLDYYGLQLIDIHLEPVDIDEIDGAYFPELLQDLRCDFELKNEGQEESLELLDLEEVIRVIDETVKRCVHSL